MLQEVYNLIKFPFLIETCLHINLLLDHNFDFTNNYENLGFICI